MAAFRLTSPAFGHDEELPLKYTAEAGDVSPPLAWEGVPEGTKELALVCEDPDADTGVITHWLVYGIPPDATALPEGLPRDTIIEDPVWMMQGLNEFDEAGYSGPSQEDDRVAHRFFFRLYALDVELDISPGLHRSDLRTAAKGHVLATAELVGIA